MRTSLRGMVVVCLCLGLMAFGCGNDPGKPDYSGHDGLVPDEDEKFEEPDPYQLGEERLAVDVFYEGGRSETIKINGFRTHYFIFGRAELGRDTYSIAPSPNRVEGEQSDRITLAGTIWWGGGIVWDDPIDLSAWKKLFVSFKSSDSSFDTFEMSLLSGTGESPRSVVLDPTDYGYTNDGNWHTLEIPLADAIARGFDPSAVRSPLVLGGPGGEAGHRLLVDNFYLTKY